MEGILYRLFYLFSLLIQLGLDSTFIWIQPVISWNAPFISGGLGFGFKSMVFSYLLITATDSGLL